MKLVLQSRFLTPAAILAGLILCNTVSFAEPRTWKDASGKFEIEAEFVEFENGKVTLKKTDGKETVIAMTKLSAADQAFVRAELKARKDGSKTTKPGKSTSSKPVATSAADGDWSQWRGPHRDGVSTERGLLDSWPDSGPPIAWQTRGLGQGYSSVAVASGKIFTMGTRKGREQLMCLDASDGKELWSLAVGRGDHSNCTPTVDGNLVFAVGLQGDLVSATADMGKEVWRKNYAGDFGGQMMSSWGFSESPLVDGDRVICTPGGGRAMLTALDKQTGKVAWSAPMAGGGPAGKDGAGYSSVVVSEACGVRQYVQLVGRGVVSVSAKDGTPLWTYNRIANGTANIPTPIVKGDYVFCSSGYDDGGTALLKVNKGRAGLSVDEVYYFKAREMQNHHGGMILLGNHVYMGHGHNNGFPMCVEFLTGKVAWKPGRGAGSGSAAIAYADGNLYFRYEDATMALIEATPKDYNLKGSFRIASRNDKSWPHPVISHGKLYLRDQDELHCYDVAKK